MDAERKIAKELRAILGTLVEKMEQSRSLGMRVSFNIPLDPEGKYSDFTADIVKVIE